MIAWLNDAHAMELSLVQNLEEMAKDAEDAGKADVQAKIEAHIEETKQHAIQVEACIRRLGGSPSVVKDVMGKTMGYMQGAMKSMFADTMVKNAIESYAAEHVEIAAYTSLIAAAEEIEDFETAEICEAILSDEERMAAWALEQIPVATQEHLQDNK